MMRLEKKASTSPQNRMKSKQADSEPVPVLDPEIDKLLEDKAAKSNLSVFNVKSIIRQVIKNPMVQEVVGVTMRRAANENATEEDNVDTALTSINETMTFCFEPKLTRAKTKELIRNKDQLQLPLWPISPAKLVQVQPPPTETQILITSQDLPEESEAEDDEYIPKEADLHASDDEASRTSMSDIGSPSTPSTVRRSTATKRRREALGTPNRFNSVDSVFKTPSPKKQNVDSPRNAIGLRTRSKLPLNDTPLEVLEKQLIPPDITTDMYEWNESDNEDYLQFLKTFAFSATPDGGNDDEEADPEYNVMEDEEDDHDKEEHRVDRAVKVSKKELNELIAELFDNYQISDNTEEPGYSFAPPPKQQSPVDSKSPKTNTVSSAKSVGNDSEVKPENEELPSVALKPENEELPLVTSEEPAQPIATLRDDDEKVPNEAIRTPTVSQNTARKTLATQTDDPIADIIKKEEDASLFSVEMLETLRHQMQKHIQLLATAYVICSSQEEPLSVKAGHSAKSLLLEISRQAELNGVNSVFSGQNLAAAVEVVYAWPTRAPQTISNSSPIKKKILEEYRCQPRGVPEYGLRAIKLIAESPAFMYPALLPSSVSVNYTRTPTFVFTASEDNLIARGLDELATSYVPLREKAKIIAETLLPVRTPRQIYDRVKNIRKQKCCLLNNGLKAFFDNRDVPSATPDTNLPTEARAPIQQPREYLSQKWTKNIEALVKASLTASKLLMYEAKKSAIQKISGIQKNSAMKKGPGRKRKVQNVDATEQKYVRCDSPTHILPDDGPELKVLTTVKQDADCKIFTITNDKGELKFYYTVPTIVVQEAGTIETQSEVGGGASNDTADACGASYDTAGGVSDDNIGEGEASNDTAGEEEASSNSSGEASADTAGEASRDTGLEIIKSSDNAVAGKASGDNVGPAFSDATSTADEPTEVEVDKSESDKVPSTSERPPADTSTEVVSTQQSSQSTSTSTQEDRNDGDEGEDDEPNRKHRENFSYEEPVADDLAEELTETTDEENLDTSDHVKEVAGDNEGVAFSCSTPEPTEDQRLTKEKTPPQGSKKRRHTYPSSELQANRNKRKKDKTTPVVQLLEASEQEDEDVLEAFSEAFLISVRHRLETKNPSVYASFLHLFNDCLVNEMSDEELYSKAEELLKDFPDLIEEFRGLQTAEVAFTTGSFIQYQESHAQIHFLQLLEKWTVNCPQLKTKIIQKLKSLQDRNVPESKVVDVMQPLFSQIQNPLILDSFKALFPTVYRPQTIVSDADYEEMDLDGDDKHESHGHPTAEIELDSFETVKLPEEKQVIATNSCPCSCHEDAGNVHYHTRARHCNKCCLRFQDGKLFLHSGRVMKPVSIEFPSSELSKQVFAQSTYVASKSAAASTSTSARLTPTSSPLTSTSTVLPKKPVTGAP